MENTVMYAKQLSPISWAATVQVIAGVGASAADISASLQSKLGGLPVVDSLNKSDGSVLGDVDPVVTKQPQLDPVVGPCECHHCRQLYKKFR